MRIETDFSHFITKNLRRQKGMHFIKVADKFKTGISDFLLWFEGSSCALEIKFVQALPAKPTSQALSHPFSLSQIGFLSDVKDTGNKGYGLVGIGETRSMCLLDVEKMAAAKGKPSGLDLYAAKTFPLTEKGIIELVDFIFKDGK